MAMSERFQSMTRWEMYGASLGVFNFTHNERLIKDATAARKALLEEYGFAMFDEVISWAKQDEVTE